MAETMAGWEGELGRWLKPFVERLGHKARQRMCPLYVAGLIGPGDRKSVAPMAERFAPCDYDQMHHFVAAGVWDAAPLETELLLQADKIVGATMQYWLLTTLQCRRKASIQSASLRNMLRPWARPRIARRWCH
jgi:SRSO17 transposase